MTAIRMNSGTELVVVTEPIEDVIAALVALPGSGPQGRAGVRFAKFTSEASGLPVYLNVDAISSVEDPYGT